MKVSNFKTQMVKKVVLPTILLTGIGFVSASKSYALHDSASSQAPISAPINAKPVSPVNSTTPESVLGMSPKLIFSLGAVFGLVAGVLAAPLFSKKTRTRLLKTYHPPLMGSFFIPSFKSRQSESLQHKDQ